MGTRGREFVGAGKFVLLGNYTNVLITLLVSIVLARMLTPSDFGIMALIMLVINFLQVVGNSGVAISIIQFGEKFSRGSLTGLFIIILIGSSLLAVSLFASAIYIEELVSYRNLAVYIRYISPIVVFSILAGAMRALLINSKKFSLVSYISIVATLTSGAIGIVCAYLGMGIFSLLYKIFFYHLILFMLYLYNTKRRFSIKPIFTFPPEFFSYMVNGLYSQLAGYAMRNLDTFLVGKFLGDAALGLYDVSFKLMRQPVTSLAKVFTPIIQPLFKSFDSKELYSAYSRIARIMTIIGWAISLVFGVWGKQIFLIIYGDKWLEGGTIFQIMSVTIIFHLLLSGVGGVMLASGSQRVLSRSITFSMISTIVCLLIGINSGDLELVAYFYVLATLINFIQSFYLLFRNVFTEYTIREVRKTFVFNAVFVYILLYVLYFIFSYWLNLDEISFNINVLFTCVGLGITIYYIDKYKFLNELRYVFKNIRKQ